MGLRGKRVLVTRAREQAASFVTALEAEGAVPVELPTIRIAPPIDSEAFVRAIARANHYDWIIFTSVNGVEAFYLERARLSTAGRSSEPLRAKIAAIGPATAEALDARGIPAELVPDEYRGEAVAEAMRTRLGTRLRNATVLVPRAAGARAALPDMLRESGARVDVVEAYRTLAPDPNDARRLRFLLETSALDAVTFTSSSTVSNTVTILGNDAPTLLKPFTVASIGPITTQTAQKYRLRVNITASEYTIRGLVKALKTYYLE